MERKPRGYVGRGHETIGSDILAVVHALQHLSGRREGSARESVAAQVLGAAKAAQLAGVQPDGWYPIEWLISAMETLEAKLGAYGLRQVGRTLFKLSHQERVLQVASSGRDIVEGIDSMYHHANRGEALGGWKVLSFESNRAELEKTTPHHCAMEEGILSEALSAVGAPSVVSQRQCFRTGAPACIYVITPSISGPRWEGAAPASPVTAPRATSSRPRI